MKKVIIFILTLLMLVGIPTAAMAMPAPKTADVFLSSSAVTVQPGETVTITATTLKHGSNYTDEWIGATKTETVLTEDGYYVSTAEVTAQAAVTVQYKISMTAGNSEVLFTGQAETAVSVEKPAAAVVGVEVRNIAPAPDLAGLYCGDVYVVLSDGTENAYGTTFFRFCDGQTTKQLYITVAMDGKTYSYTVNVSQ